MESQSSHSDVESGGLRDNLSQGQVGTIHPDIVAKMQSVMEDEGILQRRARRVSEYEDLLQLPVNSDNLKRLVQGGTTSDRSDLEIFQETLDAFALPALGALAEGNFEEADSATDELFAEVGDTLLQRANDALQARFDFQDDVPQKLMEATQLNATSDEVSRLAASRTLFAILVALMFGRVPFCSSTRLHGAAVRQPGSVDGVNGAINDMLAKRIGMSH